MLSTSKKKLFLTHGKIFQLVNAVQHHAVFSKGLLGEFCQLQHFKVKIYLFFPRKSPTEILKLMPQRWHTSELGAFVDFFGVRE